MQLIFLNSLIIPMLNSVYSHRATSVLYHVLYYFSVTLFDSFFKLTNLLRDFLCLLLTQYRQPTIFEDVTNPVMLSL